METTNVIIDPFWKKFNKLRDADRTRLGVEIFRLFEDLKAKLNFQLPEEFLENTVESFDWSDIQTVRASMADAKTLRELLVGTSLDTDVTSVFKSNSPPY